MGDTTSNIVVTASNKARQVLLGVGKDFDHITAGAKKAETAVARMGTTTAGHVDGMLARFARLTSQSNILGRSMGVAFGEGAEGMTRSLSTLALVGAGLAGVGAVVGKFAWDAGAKALKEQAGGAKTNVDLLNEAIQSLGKSVGTAAAPAVDAISGSLAIMINNATGGKKSIEELRLELQRLQDLQKGGGAQPGAGMVQTSYGVVPATGGSGQMYLQVTQGAEAAAAAQAELQRQIDVTQAAIAEAEKKTGIWANSLTRLDGKRVVVTLLINGRTEFADWTDPHSWWNTTVANAAPTGAPSAAWLRGVEGGRTEPGAAGPAPLPGSAAAMRKAELEAIIAANKEAAEKIAAAEKKAAGESQAAWESTFNSMSSQADSFADTARNASKALTPGGEKGPEDWLKPGANGPFENLFRAKDIAVHGDASQWAKALGMDQETAKQVVAEFEAGIMSAGVQALIDKQAIVDRVKLEQLAQQTQAAFAEEIAKAAGASTKGVDELLGFTSTKVATGAANVGTAFKTAVDADTQYQAAGVIAGGDMVAGLDSKISAFAASGTAAGKAYIDAFNAAAGIHSPSTEMMKAGRNLVAGLNAGIASGYKQPTVGVRARIGGGRGGNLNISAPASFTQNTFIINNTAAFVAAMAAGRAARGRRLST